MAKMINSMSTFVETQTLVTETCCKCGVLFAMPSTWQAHFKKNHKSFFCPAGHGQHYTQECEEERLKRHVAQLQTFIEHKDARIQEVINQRESLKHQRDGMKGALRKVSVRVKNGVCPCCKRTFSCLADHMASKHPEFCKDQK